MLIWFTIQKNANGEKIRYGIISEEEIRQNKAIRDRNFLMNSLTMICERRETG